MNNTTAAVAPTHIKQRHNASALCAYSSAVSFTNIYVCPNHWILSYFYFASLHTPFKTLWKYFRIFFLISKYSVKTISFHTTCFIKNFI